MKSPICNLSRRQFLHSLTGAAAGLVLVSPWRDVFAGTADRSLSFYHTHTGEHLKLTYFSDGIYQTEALKEINYCLRDFRTNEIRAIDSQLLDILHLVQKTCNSNGTFEIISGYRSPRTNQSLREHGAGVAEYSLHITGKAIDVRLTDVKTAYLMKAAVSLKRGGAGYYAKSDFVHIDSGRIRSW